MLLRICLFLTIAAGGATVYFALVPVKEIITTTRADRDDFHTKLTAETDLYTKTDKTLKKTKADLDSTTAKLNTTQSELDSATARNSELTKANADLNNSLAKMTTRADDAEASLSKWGQLPPPEQIKGIINDLAATKRELAAVTNENILLKASRDEYMRRLFLLVGDSAEVVMPVGLKGTVMAVDPKYDFVVLNIGDQQGVKERGQFMVDRKGKLIGKVSVTKVERDRCIATIMADWKRGQIMEGDQVIY